MSLIDDLREHFSTDDNQVLILSKKLFYYLLVKNYYIISFCKIISFFAIFIRYCKLVSIIREPSFIF